MKEALDTTTPGGRLFFHIFAALAEFIRELIVEGTQEGLAPPRLAAFVSGVRLRRRPNRSGTPAPCSPNPTPPCPRSPGC
ncbi:recombinase family protein [Nonomuraea lactucae]|uniref:recombinase family protein n=1 Tax=Nonomuraea lactucae TaxID=2249762 RepID=UPI0023DD1DD7|nr:recombinase family protein [Nonomuraea lactucae]